MTPKKSVGMPCKAKGKQKDPEQRKYEKAMWEGRPMEKENERTGKGGRGGMWRPDGADQITRGKGHVIEGDGRSGTHFRLRA